jgi:hypothetical protein
MNTCPLCNSSKVITASVGSLEVYCGSCRNILISEKLGFKFAAGAPEACSRDGLPGYKGPGDAAKCYVYQPGDEQGEKAALARAEQSAYMEQRSLKGASIVTADPIWDAFPNKVTPEAPVPATNLTEDGVLTGTMQDVGSGRTPLASFHPTMIGEEFENLGRATCTSCGKDHPFGDPCI